MATNQEADDEDQVQLDMRQPTSAGTSSSAAAAATVTFRRTKGRDSLKRLSDILSAYIPVRGHQQQQHQPLLEAATEEDAASSPPVSPGAGFCGYRTLMLLDVASLRSTEFASSRENLDNDAAEGGVEEPAALADGDITGVALSASGFAFLTFNESANILRLEVQPKGGQGAAASKTTCRLMQVKLKGGVSLVPTDIRVYKEKLYVCGSVRRQVEDQTAVTMSTIVRCDLDCKVELASKELPNPRFYGFDIDPADDQLVVASPTPDGHTAQIFKMSADFRRKLFKIQLGNGSSGSSHKPQFVACHGGGVEGQCWVTSEQHTSNRVEQASEDDATEPNSKHRLLSFPLRPPAQGEATAAATATTKSWMKVSSWKFQGIQPGRLLAIPASGGDEAPQEERLLMLSQDRGNIYCVSEKLGCSPLTHPSSEGGQIFTAFCRLQEPCDRPGATALDILAATKDSLYLLQAS